MARKTGRSNGQPDPKKLARRIARLEKRVGSAAREEKRRARRLERTRQARTALEQRLAALRAGAEPAPAAPAGSVAAAGDRSTDGSHSVPPVDQGVHVDRPAEAPAHQAGTESGPSYERSSPYESGPSF